MLEADARGDTLPAEATRRNTLPKERLIRSGDEYRLCYASGQRLHTRHFLLFVAPPEEGGSSMRMGTAVSRKVGHAVVRNRIRRLLRECFRLHLKHLPVAVRLVVVAKRSAGTADLSLDEVTAELLKALSFYQQQAGGQ